MPLIGLPSQTMVPSPSISRLITSGCWSGGGGWAFGFGISSFTACVITGSEMISVTSSTSITSISGVVLMSHMASDEGPTLIDIDGLLGAKASAVAAHAVVGLGEEADLDDAAALDGVHDPPDRLVARLLVAADMHFRLRLPDGGRLDQAEQLVAIGHPLVVPVNDAVLVDRDGDVLGLGLGRDV